MGLPKKLPKKPIELPKKLPKKRLRFKGISSFPEP
jgi:hypothetical protein